MNEYRPLVLMVEDNLDVLRLNKKYLTKSGFDTVSATTLAETRKILKTRMPDIVILDILLPDGNGLTFLPELKALCDAPVLFCSSQGEDNDMIRGLNAGGDDYIPKPYNVDVLTARVEALLRRAKHEPETVLTKGDLTLDMTSQSIVVNGESSQLPQKEFAVLLYFVRNEAREIGAVELYQAVWNQPMCDDANAVKIAVTRLRKKIRPAGFDIISMRGIAYCFEKSDSPMQ